MKKYTYEVTYEVSTNVEVEADTEEEARKLAFQDAENRTVGEMKEWKSEIELQKSVEQCENCCEEYDIKTEPLQDYQGVRLCEDCVKWAKVNPQDFNYIFRKQLNK